MFPHLSPTVKLAQLFTLLISFALSVEPLIGQHQDPLPFDTTNYELQSAVYKETPQADLELHFYKPKLGSREPSPAILFFFGGGWTGGNHQHFATHSKYLAAPGIIAITADYRLRKEHGTSPIEAIQDARDALHYLAEHGTKMGLDTTKIAVGGGSAGGHLALCTALIDHFDEAEKLGYTPKALVLYNPVVNTTSVGFGSKMLGKDTINASPYHHVAVKMPPILIFHGEDDTTVPISNIYALEEKMDSLGIEHKIYVYPGQKHGFFNVGRQPDHRYFLETLYRTHQFLVDQSFLTGQPLFELNNKID